MAASRMISGSFKPFVLAQAIDTELFELVKLMRKSIMTIDDEYLNALQGEKGFKIIEVGSEFNNNVVFIETKCGKGIEAW
ncbi:hypothetical protein Goklo_005075, partial [Gossypium klotzschianum]|nr:hypothetical protein [Gossypium klotzschianum]